MEPYRFANGETWGEEPPKPRKRLPRGALVLRARRVRTDPNWSGYSDAAKRALIEADARDAEFMRRRKEEGL